MPTPRPFTPAEEAAIRAASALFAQVPIAHQDTTGYAPEEMSWMAIDDSTYDGAPDAGRQIVGWGATAADAIADFHFNAADATSLTIDFTRLEVGFSPYRAAERTEG